MLTVSNSVPQFFTCCSSGLLYIVFMRAHNENAFIQLVKRKQAMILRSGEIFKLDRRSGQWKRADLSIRKSGYRVVHYRGHGINAHRLVWTYYNGFIPDDMVVHHRNAIKWDNHIDNLDLVTQSENIAEAHKHRLRNVVNTYQIRTS